MDAVELSGIGGHRLAAYLFEKVLMPYLNECSDPRQIISSFNDNYYNPFCFLFKIYFYDAGGAAVDIDGEKHKAAVGAVIKHVKAPFKILPLKYEGHDLGLVSFQTTRMISELMQSFRDGLAPAISEMEAVSGHSASIITSSIGIGLGSSDFMLRELLFSADIVVSDHPEDKVNTSLMMLDSPVQNARPQTEIERQFVDSVLELDFKKSLTVMEKIIDNEWSTPDLALTIRQRIAKRLDWVLIVLRLPKSKSDMRTLSIDRYSGDILRAESVDALRELVKAFFGELNDFYLAIRYNAACHVEQITDFIRENYADPNMSAAMICNTFRLSSSYLSHMFKQKTGVKLIDFIHSVKLSHGKALLLETDLTVTQIAEKTGYVSGGALTRSFRRYENLTPSDFRLQKRNNM